ncbi:DUF1294 domain-containing protein [Comamonas sp.]|uniref:DUF1294 domain-containing protein n=1 Tax=Comamonas sp. TaxID=34028 RepID=UPI00289C6980|nr:DUF1294 domain-containing protein [Comamonas sp.]
MDASCTPTGRNHARPAPGYQCCPIGRIRWRGPVVHPRAGGVAAGTGPELWPTWRAAGWYLLASLVTFAWYAWDKAAARQGHWRTPEKHLWLLGLLGGWPGALLAQRWLRHKSSKQEFLQVFWLTVVLNLVGLCLLFSPLGQRLGLPVF